MGIKRKGFSLVELLIVIAIIGILVAIATVSYTTIQKRSRDSRRVSDLKAVQQAMEQYYANSQSSYPASATCSGLDTTYLPSGMPSDPKTGDAYNECNDPDNPGVTCSCAEATYCFCAAMEADTGNTTTNCNNVDTGSPLYCIYNVQ
jgi:prepilin-type N-terminal cleavage/methylation domain-containing protein